MQTRVQQAIARRERIRRARDRAWMVFAGFASAGVFGGVLLIVQFAAWPEVPWVPAAIYAAIAIVSSVFAARMFGKARTLNRQVDEAGEWSSRREEDRPPT